MLLLLLVAPIYPLLAQKEATHWYFGEKAGWSFATGSPQPVTGSAISTGYTTATISDGQTGELQFYSNGTQVWNRRHQVMPHGEGLLSFRNLSQGALILPVPGQEQQYYLFTLGLASSPAKQETNLFYSRVDMRLANGLGDVVEAEKKRELPGAFTQQLTAVRHANGRDYWVVVHKWPGATFHVFLVDPAGVRLTRQITIGPSLRSADFILATEGFLRASPDGRHLAYATASREVPLSLFDFDPATGNISHYISLGQLLGGGSISFSPDNTKLYAQDYRVFNQARGERNVIVQFDLSAGDDAAIAASAQSVVAGNPATNISAQAQASVGLYSLQLGPDGRLYAASEYEDATTSTTLDHVYVIPFPNRRGYACGIRYEAVDFRPGSLGPGFPNFLQHYFNGLEAQPDASVPCAQAEVRLFPNPSTGTFRVQVAGGCMARYRLSVYDMLGRRILVRTESETSPENLENIVALAAGIYWVEVGIGSATSRHRLVKY